MRPSRETSDFRIWGLAFGYFAFYVPYSGLTKALSQGSLPGMAGRPVTGYTILPATVVGTAGLLLALITAARGWRHIRRWPVPGLGLSLPSVRWATLLSGVATAVIIATTTLNYTFAGISILLALLLMRGGVLIIAPFVDLTTGRRVSAVLVGRDGSEPRGGRAGTLERRIVPDDPAGGLEYRRLPRGLRRSTQRHVAPGQERRPGRESAILL